MIHVVLAAAVTAASASAAPSELPAGHPQINQQQAHAPQNNFFRPPPDTSDEESSLPPGTIKIELRDALNNVVANRDVELGIVQQSIAKGESRKHVTQKTGPDGMTTFSGLEFGSGFAYRVVSRSDGATFAARPFNLGHEHGMHVVLHVYPVVHELPQTLQVASRAQVIVEVKDDRIQIQEHVDFFNGTPAAWVPNDVILRLPENFTALNGQQQMSDVGIDAVAKEGARLHGTFLPGQTSVVFTWQLPYANDPTVDFEVGMPPVTREAFVAAAAAPGMKLEVPGFREAVSRESEEGRLLVTSKQLNDNDRPLSKVKIGIHDLPTPGPTRLVGTALAAAGVIAGIWLASQRKRVTANKTTVKRDRERILDEVTELERAHTRGDVGPKTYERARRELVDELANLLAGAKS